MPQQEYQRILVAIDGSESAKLAFKKAVAVALRNEGSLVIAHVIDERVAVAQQSPFDSFSQQHAITFSTDDSREAALNTLKSYKEYAQKQGVKDVQTVVEYGNPKSIIAHTLPEVYDIDLIMMGATGLNAVERFFIGSVSENVLREAISDVLIVRTDLDNKYHTT